MDIFESLEQLNISEDCFNDIMNIVESILGKAYDNGELSNEPTEQSTKPDYKEDYKSKAEFSKDKKEKKQKILAQYNLDKSIKRKAAKKVRDYVKNRKTKPSIKTDLSNKETMADMLNTRNGQGEYKTALNQAHNSLNKNNIISYRRGKENDYGGNSVKYTPEVKSVARNMKKNQ